MPTGPFLRSKRLITVYSHLGGLNSKDFEQELGIIRVSADIPESQHSALRIEMEKKACWKGPRETPRLCYT